MTGDNNSLLLIKIQVDIEWLIERNRMRKLQENNALSLKKKCKHINDPRLYTDEQL